MSQGMGLSWQAAHHHIPVFSHLLEGNVRQAGILWVWVDQSPPRSCVIKEKMVRSLPVGGGWHVQAFLGTFVLGLVGQELTSVCASQPVSNCAPPPQTISALKGRVSELQWSVMNQEMQVKSLESEKQELKEQLALQHK